MSGKLYFMAISEVSKYEILRILKLLLLMASKSTYNDKTLICSILIILLPALKIILDMATLHDRVKSI